MDGGMFMSSGFVRDNPDVDVDFGSSFAMLQQIWAERQAEGTVNSMDLTGMDAEVLGDGSLCDTTDACLPGEGLAKFHPGMANPASQGACLEAESLTPFHGNMVENGGDSFAAQFGVDGSGEGVYLEGAPMQLESSEADPLKDPVFNYISDMLMDEEHDERTCMFIDCTGYQAMASELTQLISDTSSSAASPLDSNDPAKDMDTWIDGLLIHDEVSSEQHPKPEEAPGLLAQPLPDEALEENLIHYLGNMQHAIEKGSAPEAAPEPVPVEPKAEEQLPRITSKHFRNLQSFFVECSDYLKGQPNDNWPEHPPFFGDLHPTENQVEAGLIRVVEEDIAAIENEQAARQELHAKLMECAQAVGGDDKAKAYDIVNSIRNKVSPHGTGTERLGFYFTEALVARITGTGALLYSTLNSSWPPMIEVLKAHCLFTRYSPNVRISHYFTNQTILDVSAGASRVHIVDYGILYGFGWPCLIKAFSERKDGPPHLRITGIDFPQSGFKPAERVEETGRRLAEYAKKVGVPFEFHAVATAKWESVQASTLFLRHDEVLIVSSQFRLKHLLDESVMVDSPRKLVLSRIRSMRPKVFIQAVMNANYNAPFFLSRFREALSFYTVLFDAIDTAVSPEHPERLLIEQSFIGREILNVVACEGLERVERAETYKQWQSRTSKAGFEQLPVRPEIYEKARAMLSTYHKGFGIGQDGNWLLLGWKEAVIHAMSTWRPR